MATDKESIGKESKGSDTAVVNEAMVGVEFLMLACTASKAFYLQKQNGWVVIKEWRRMRRKVKVHVSPAIQPSNDCASKELAKGLDEIGEAAS